MKTSSSQFLIVTLMLLSMVACQSNTENSTETNTSADSVSVTSDSTSNETTPLTLRESAPYAYGIDISRAQANEIDSLNVDTDSLSFIICKATEGVTYTDPNFTENWSTIPQKGFIRGAYHFYHTNDDPTEQATFFVNSLVGLNQSDLAPVLDIEEGGIVAGTAVAAIQADLMVFLKAVEQLSGRKPIIYTNVNVGNKYLDNPEFSSYALWIAYPAEVVEPELPTTWATTGWSLWQESWSYQIDGYTDDFDKYNGNLAALKQFIADY